MAWDKSPAELVERFKGVAPGGPEAVEKPMFGYPAAFVRGYMFMGLFADTFIVRLSPEGIVAAKAAGAADFSPQEGRTMKNYVSLPAEVVADDVQLRSWVARAYAEALALPPKESKPKAPKAKPASRDR